MMETAAGAVVSIDVYAPFVDRPDCIIHRSGYSRPHKT
jgi:hypothetical protein